MKNLLSLRLQLIMFSLLFAAGMWMSKVAQPLYFETRGAMIAFGVGYAVMAIVGGLSFAWGWIADRVGGLNAVRVGTLVYAIGICGRIYTGMAPSIVFSAIAGAGASLALVGIRPWIRSRASDDEISKIVASRSFGTQAGTFVGTLGAALIFALASQAETGQRTALLVAPALALCGIAWTFFSGSATIRPAPSPAEEVSGHHKASTRALMIKLSVLGILAGFYASLVVPFRPIILTDAGLTDAEASIAISVMSLMQMMSTGVLTRVRTSPRPYRLFFISESTAALLTLLAALVLHLPGIVVAAVFVMRAAFLALAATAEETIQFAVIPAGAVGFVFGVSQSAFLIGDAAGGAVGAVLWRSAGPWGLLITAAVITGVNAVLLPLLLKRKSAAHE